VRVFVAGATGAIGRPLLPRLRAAGHEVSALTRSEAKATALRAAGVEAYVADAFDGPAVRAAVAAARPEVVVNELTDLPPALDPKRYDEQLQGTNRLRAEATPILAEAARAVGARRLISQSVSFGLPPDGARVVDETAPGWGDDAPAAARANEALERATLETEGLEGVVLRYGFFYGPGTAVDRDGSTGELIAKRKFPIVGAGTGLWSFVHVDDAADATVLALDRGAPGVYNVTDDLPVAVRDWVPAAAAQLGAKPPRRVPLWLAKLLVGDMAVSLVHGSGQSNAKAKAAFGWQPSYPTYREGFPVVFARP
jgi:nucleoside-diphosphate-sugar epimerase